MNFRKDRLVRYKNNIKSINLIQKSACRFLWSDLKIGTPIFCHTNRHADFFAFCAIKSAAKSSKSDKNIQKSDGLFANRQSDFWPIFTHSTCALCLGLMIIYNFERSVHDNSLDNRPVSVQIM